MRQGGFFTGLIVGAVGTIALLGLSPTTRRYMRPVFQVLIDQVTTANERLQQSMQHFQEEMEEFVVDGRHRAAQSTSNVVH